MSSKFYVEDSLFGTQLPLNWNILVKFQEEGNCESQLNSVNGL